MLYSTTTPQAKREALRAHLTSGRLTVLPGAFNGLSALMIARHGFPGIYVSGHMIAADLGLPDTGLTTLSEVTDRGRQLARVVDVPAVIDADTGFGEPTNAARSVQALEDAGLAGCHIEDQVNPKRCGHSDGLEVVDRRDAIRRVRAAVAGRRDPSFVVIARTDAAAVFGLGEAIDRARAFADAGADVVFPEALAGPREYEALRASVDVPLMINLNEFGRGRPVTCTQAEDLGYDVAIYPMTLMRVAMGAVDSGLRHVRQDGHQRQLLERMQTKEELYELLGYDDYAAFEDHLLDAEGAGTGEGLPARRAGGS